MMAGFKCINISILVFPVRFSIRDLCLKGLEDTLCVISQLAIGQESSCADGKGYLQDIMALGTWCCDHRYGVSFVMGSVSNNMHNRTACTLRAFMPDVYRISVLCGILSVGGTLLRHILIV